MIARSNDRPKGVFQGVPTFFRCCCQEVSGQRSGYESIGYAHPGRELMRHLPDLEPFDLDEVEWLQQLRQLSRLLESDDDGLDEAIVQWFVDHYPKCMALIPRRRRQMFLKGVREMYDEGAWSVPREELIDLDAAKTC